MEQAALDILNRLTHTSVNSLTEDEKAFIRARRDYLSESEKEFYTKNGVLTEPKTIQEEPVATSEEEPTEEKAKKGKKSE